ncbi:MAG TPA: hypothetical protein VFI31_24885, partial [Pirellulales bacterium]|nr:hypothetical protein [Pirellulales bacterium]
MDEVFDPYWDWLKIPPDRRPPTHYDLLGLPAFEADQSLIRQASIDRMAVVRRYQMGERALDALRLQAEISRALDRLSDVENKRCYDAQLRSDATRHESQSHSTLVDQSDIQIIGGADERSHAQSTANVPSKTSTRTSLPARFRNLTSRLRAGGPGLLEQSL